jgi:hypothetical protein
VVWWDAVDVIGVDAYYPLDPVEENPCMPSVLAWALLARSGAPSIAAACAPPACSPISCGSRVGLRPRCSELRFGSREGATSPACMRF